jgi:hypothetical protein
MKLIKRQLLSRLGLLSLRFGKGIRICKHPRLQAVCVFLRQGPAPSRLGFRGLLFCFSFLIEQHLPAAATRAQYIKRRTFFCDASIPARYQQSADDYKFVRTAEPTTHFHRNTTLHRGHIACASDPYDDAEAHHETFSEMNVSPMVSSPSLCLCVFVFVRLSV